MGELFWGEAMAKVKVSARDVDNICQVRSRSQLVWVERLDADLRAVCEETRDRVVKQDLPPYVVAENLATYLLVRGFKISTTTIGRWLAHAKKTK